MPRRPGRKNNFHASSGVWSGVLEEGNHLLIIGFCNLKGGVGKTTACQNVAVGLARLGKRVAVLDMDPQSNLSASFGISVAPGALQIFDLLSREARWDDVVSSKEGIDIIPSSLDLVMAELHPEGAIGKDTLLREASYFNLIDMFLIFIIRVPQALNSSQLFNLQSRCKSISDAARFSR